MVSLESKWALASGACSSIFTIYGLLWSKESRFSILSVSSFSFLEPLGSSALGLWCGLGLVLVCLPIGLFEDKSRGLLLWYLPFLEFAGLEEAVAGVGLLITGLI